MSFSVPGDNETHLPSRDSSGAMKAALRTIGELADSALHCMRTEIRLTCYSQIHLMRGRRYSWEHASQIQRNARNSPVPEAFVVSLAQYLCSIEEEVIPSLFEASRKFLIHGLPQLITQLLLDGVRHTWHNKICDLGVKQLACNCRALANVWICCQGLNDDRSLNNEAQKCFQFAERAIEMLALPPKWLQEILEDCKRTKSNWESTSDKATDMPINVEACSALLGLNMPAIFTTLK